MVSFFRAIHQEGLKKNRNILNLVGKRRLVLHIISLNKCVLNNCIERRCVWSVDNHVVG